MQSNEEALEVPKLESFVLSSNSYIFAPGVLL